MAHCKRCNKKLTVMDERYEFKDGSFHCSQCQKESRTEKRSDIEAILLTTETAPNLNITKRIEIVSAECAFGMNIFKDLFASVRDIVGGRSEAVQKTMRDSRRTVLYELKKEAHMVGANAVVGVDLDYMEMSSAGSMVLLVASGTAVVIDNSKDPTE
ncbi:heavy metal-binding domain-containing protein [Rhodobacteraceae bacterium]|nr:heavy metal-binding domain-containing protein [Paracoccaceae bacterium]